jgi:hypothetical protein
VRERDVSEEPDVARPRSPRFRRDALVSGGGLEGWRVERCFCARSAAMDSFRWAVSDAAEAAEPGGLVVEFEEDVSCFAGDGSRVVLCDRGFFGELARLEDCGWRGCAGAFTGCASDSASSGDSECFGCIVMADCGRSISVVKAGSSNSSSKNGPRLLGGSLLPATASATLGVIVGGAKSNCKDLVEVVSYVFCVVKRPYFVDFKLPFFVVPWMKDLEFPERGR